MTDWQPIESAPKGNFKTIAMEKGKREVHEPERVILAVRENKWVGISWWLPDEDRWCFTSKEKNTPTHWMPLPPPPT